MRNFKVSELKVVQGRKDKPMEFTEFSGGRDQIRYVVQLGAEDRWFVYEVWPKDGPIKTLASYLSIDKEEAERFALDKMMKRILEWS